MLWHSSASVCSTRDLHPFPGAVAQMLPTAGILRSHSECDQRVGCHPNSSSVEKCWVTEWTAAGGGGLFCVPSLPTSFSAFGSTVSLVFRGQPLTQNHLLSPEYFPDALLCPLEGHCMFCCVLFQVFLITLKAVSQKPLFLLFGFLLLLSQSVAHLIT